MGRRRNASVNVLFQWVRRQSMKVKIFLGAFLALCGLVALKFWVKNHDHFFIASEAIHFLGIIVLIYKLTTQKTCSGLSLKTQELTAAFVAVRLVCSTIMEADVHTVLDFATLISTAWLIFMIRFKLKSTYIKELDNFRLYFVVVPAAILALLFHPYMLSSRITRVLWAFGGYIEAVSVLPQLRLMQNAKMIEPFTSHYVFALGISRFFACAHWIIMIYETKGKYLFLVGSGYSWILAALICEIVQTFILADFCYYYIKSYVQGQLVMRMPV
ncbi:putative ER lumen protein retaining receptor [Rosa chinensis]|uniref:Putative ER lumen protein retaining receptor n=1 Tax=Rosa chinensis TaxID=74649 RepID=A0A2P6PU45_ROSCH|nr:ER lumen protein-retaining receptor erd-2.2 [Rosa chinensis]PRQ25459.1 putative ER lumen protein retaining receptor [Rosa chinensis]